MECISGSKAYGLDTPLSDTDKRGVYFVPRTVFFGLDNANQVSNASNDESYSELGRFFELLTKSNPTIIELLHTPVEMVIHRHPFFDRLTPDLYLSKKCMDTFAGYAVTQIRKAKGLNKKIEKSVF